VSDLFSDAAKARLTDLAPLAMRLRPSTLDEFVGQEQVLGKDSALRLLRRASLCLQYITGQLDMLEQMSPWEYQVIRKKLGHGSGFDSPGFREIRRITPALGQELSRLLRERGLSVVDLYVQGREHEQLYQLAECLIDWDERLTVWRMRHYKVVSRIIGDEVIGTQGTPVELLGGLIKQKFFPELWDARNRLTELANEE